MTSPCAVCGAKYMIGDGHVCATRRTDDAPTSFPVGQMIRPYGVLVFDAPGPRSLRAIREEYAQQLREGVKTFGRNSSNHAGLGTALDEVDRLRLVVKEAARRLDGGDIPRDVERYLLAALGDE